MWDRQDDLGSFNQLPLRPREALRSRSCHRRCGNGVFRAEGVSATVVPRFYTLLTLQQQTRAQALKHYSNKVEYIRKNLETLEETISRKRENMNSLISVLQSKIQQEAQTKKPTGMQT